MREMKPFSYAFGVMASFVGLTVYGHAINNDKSILVGAILITVGVVMLLYSYS